MRKIYLLFLTLLMGSGLWAQNIPDSCRANFSQAPFFNGDSVFGRVLTAIPFHNNQKKPEKICWTFGDGKDTCILYPAGAVSNYSVIHQYPFSTNPTTYNTCVKIYYQGGCIAEKCNPVVILGIAPPPATCTANFYDTLATGPNTTSGTKRFVAQPWSSNNQAVQKILWNFGDGNQLLQDYTNTPHFGPYDVVHTYPVSGLYNVCIKIWYVGGCIAEKCRPIQIQVNPPPPPADSCRAEFIDTLQASANPLHRYFIALPWHNNNKKPEKICWTFGDNRDTCITYSNSFTGTYGVNHIYQQPGIYNVCVKIFYAGGCIANKCRSVVIATPPPPPADSCRADFVYSDTLNIPGTNPLIKRFTALPWHSNNKKPVKICWTFGDNKDTCINYTSAFTGLYTVNHTYAQPGTYNVCVKIYYDGGCIANKCRPVIVFGNPPPPADSCRADFVADTLSINAGTPLLKRFIALPWHSNNKKPVKICWTFGDNKDTCITYTAAFTNQYMVYHQYQQPGVYTVCVKIFYEGGCIADKCRPVLVGTNPPPPPDSCYANFTTEPISNTSSLTRRFKALPWHSQNKKPVLICWKFGNGRDTCIQYNPALPSDYSITYTYPLPGTYAVCVRIVYQGGCVGEYCRPVVVTAPTPPVQCLSNFSDSAISRFVRKFKGTAITQPNDPVVQWNWTFGDGTAGTGQNIIHAFPRPGSFNVCLKTRTASGCERTVCKVIRIDSLPRILVLAPNPVQNVLYVSFWSLGNAPAQATIKIFNIFGIAVRTYVRTVQPGQNNFMFNDLGSLPPGPYSLVVQTSSQLASSVFFKQ